MEEEKRRGTSQQDFFYFSYKGGISLLPPFQVYSYLIITVISHILDKCKLRFFSWWNSGPAKKLAGITKSAMSRERNRAQRRSTHKTSQWISCRTRSTTNKRRHVCLASAVIGQRTLSKQKKHKYVTIGHTCNQSLTEHSRIYLAKQHEQRRR